MKIIILSQKFIEYFFSDPCFYVTVQKFRQPHYVIQLHATVVGMILKGLVKFISVW